MKKLAALLVLVLSVSVNFDCSKVTGIAADLLISDSQEVAMGKNFVAQIDSDDTNFPLYKDNPNKNQALIDYIDSIGNHLATTQTRRTEITYHFEIIDQDTIINAFAVPGGFIYIYTGLIKEARNEAEIAGVLAHEIAHITERHGAKRMIQAYGLDFVLTLVAGESGALRTVLDLGSVFGFLKYSRDNEFEADSLAAEYLVESDYNPNGMKTFMQLLSDMSGSLRLPAFLSTHPDPDDRVAALTTIIDAKPDAVKNRPIPDKRVDVN